MMLTASQPSLSPETFADEMKMFGKSATGSTSSGYCSSPQASDESFDGDKADYFGSTYKMWGNETSVGANSAEHVAHNILSQLFEEERSKSPPANFMSGDSGIVWSNDYQSTFSETLSSPLSTFSDENSDPTFGQWSGGNGKHLAPGSQIAAANPSWPTSLRTPQQQTPIASAGPGSNNTNFSQNSTNVSLNGPNFGPSGANFAQNGASFGQNGANFGQNGANFGQNGTNFGQNSNFGQNGANFQQNSNNFQQTANFVQGGTNFQSNGGNFPNNGSGFQSGVSNNNFHNSGTFSNQFNNSGFYPGNNHQMKMLQQPSVMPGFGGRSVMFGSRPGTLPPADVLQQSILRRKLSETNPFVGGGGYNDTRCYPGTSPNKLYPSSAATASMMSLSHHKKLPLSFSHVECPIPTQQPQISPDSKLLLSTIESCWNQLLQLSREQKKYEYEVGFLFKEFVKPVLQQPKQKNPFKLDMLIQNTEYTHAVVMLFSDNIGKVSKSGEQEKNSIARCVTLLDEICREMLELRRQIHPVHGLCNDELIRKLIGTLELYRKHTKTVRSNLFMLITTLRRTK